MKMTMTKLPPNTVIRKDDQGVMFQAENQHEVFTLGEMFSNLNKEGIAVNATWGKDGSPPTACNIVVRYQPMLSYLAGYHK